MITAALHAVREGRKADFSNELNELYRLLRSMAARALRRESQACTLKPTELINEAWLRLGPEHRHFRDRRHFFASAAQAMRRVLIEQARARLAAKRGHGMVRVEEQGDWPADLPDPAELADLDTLLGALEQRDPELARIVSLRCFAGFTVAEIADIDGVTERTVFRQWAIARSWLDARLQA